MILTWPNVTVWRGQWIRSVCGLFEIEVDYISSRKDVREARTKRFVIPSRFRLHARHEQGRPIVGEEGRRLFLGQYDDLETAKRMAQLVVNENLLELVGKGIRLTSEQLAEWSETFRAIGVAS